MEKEPTFENQENPEQQLVRLLKEKGAEDPETRNLLISWTIEQERSVEGSADPEASIQFNLRRARLYFEAGYVDEALENFEAAKTQAWNEHRDELYQSITEEISKFEKQQQKSRVEEAKDIILNSAEKIEDEFRRTGNTWLECFGSRVFVVETYLFGEKVKAELGIEKYNEIMRKLEILKQRLYDLKQQYPDKNTIPSDEIKQELLEMLDVLR